MRRVARLVAGGLVFGAFAIVSGRAEACSSNGTTLSAMEVVARVNEPGTARPEPTSRPPASPLDLPASLLVPCELDGDGGHELVLIGMRGELRVLTGAGAERAKEAEPGEAALLARGGDRMLANPLHSLVMAADLFGGPGEELVILDSDGLWAWEAEAGGGFKPDPVRLSARAKLRLRTGRPLLAPFLRDVNGDGLEDLLLPDPRGLELWLGSRPTNEPVQDPDGSEPDVSARGEGGSGTGESSETGSSVRARPSFRRVARIDSEASAFVSANAQRISNRFLGALSIPDLRTEDLNGDGREDIVVTRGERSAFHLQDEAGNFPVEPNVRLDLSIFEDRSPRPALRPGEIVSSGDDKQLSRRDLDGDGIPDFLIAHRRKVWVFHGTDEGPQFREPSAILKVAEEVTALTTLALDEDDLPDLLLIKVEIPPIATLLTGLLTDWSLEVRAIGYRNLGERRFATEPTWRRTLEMSLPPILDLVRHPERMREKFAGIGDDFRAPTRGDFDGDGRVDLALPSPHDGIARVWSGVGGEELEARAARKRGERRMAELVFESDDNDWDIDRLLDTIGGLAAERIEGLTSGSVSSLEHELRSDETHEFLRLLSVDWTGDGRSELLAIYALEDAAHRLVIDRL